MLNDDRRIRQGRGSTLNMFSK